MDTIFTEKEFDVAKEIMNIGLSKSADSLSFFTKNKVMIQTIDLKIESIDNIAKYIKKEAKQDLYLLSTELKGELTGDCFLIFDDDEVEQLLAVSLPASMLQNPDQKAEMRTAILLELDNIVSASVITQLSNILNCKVYGDVPHLDVVNVSDLKALINEKSKIEYIFCFKANFKTENVTLQPEFIWGLDERFIVGVKEIAKNSPEILNKFRI